MKSMPGMARPVAWACSLALLLLFVSRCSGQSTDCSQQIAWTYSCPMNGQLYWLCEEGTAQWGCNPSKPFSSSQCTKQCTFNSTNPAYTPSNCPASVPDTCNNDQNYYTCTSSTAGGCLPQSVGWIPRCSQQCLLTTGQTPTTPSSPPPPPITLSPVSPPPPSTPLSPPPSAPLSPPPSTPLSPPPSPSPTLPPPPPFAPTLSPPPPLAPNPSPSPPPSPSPSSPPPLSPSPSPPLQPPQQPSLPPSFPPLSPSPPPFPNLQPTFSCGLPVEWQGPNAGNYNPSTNRPYAQDDMFDFMTTLCNYIASVKGTCCYLSDPYGDSFAVRTDNPQFIGSMTSYTPLPLEAGDFVQTSDTPFTSINTIEQLCPNVDSDAPDTCTLHHGVTVGQSTTVGHTWTVGGSVTVSTKGEFNLIVAGGELSVTAQVSFSWADTNSTTTTNTQQNDFTQSVPVPPGACYSLIMENVVTTATAALTSRARINGLAMMVFKDFIDLSKLVGVPPGNAFIMSPSEWLEVATILGFTGANPWYESVYSSILTRTDYLSVDYYDAVSYVKRLDPKSAQCKVPSGK